MKDIVIIMFILILITGCSNLESSNKEIFCPEFNTKDNCNSREDCYWAESEYDSEIGFCYENESFLNSNSYIKQYEEGKFFTNVYNFFVNFYNIFIRL